MLHVRRLLRLPGCCRPPGQDARRVQGQRPQQLWRQLPEPGGRALQPQANFPATAPWCMSPFLRSPRLHERPARVVWKWAFPAVPVRAVRVVRAGQAVCPLTIRIHAREHPPLRQRRPRVAVHALALRWCIRSAAPVLPEPVPPDGARRAGGPPRLPTAESKIHRLPRFWPGAQTAPPAQMQSPGGPQARSAFQVRLAASKRPAARWLLHAWRCAQAPAAHLHGLGWCGHPQGPLALTPLRERERERAMHCLRRLQCLHCPARPAAQTEFQPFSVFFFLLSGPLRHLPTPPA